MERLELNPRTCRFDPKLPAALVNAYVRGALSCKGCVSNAGIEGSGVRPCQESRMPETSKQLLRRVLRTFLEGSYVSPSCWSSPKGSTAVFTKRRFRDRWNRSLLKRIAETKNHTLKIKARMRAKGSRGSFFNERKCSWYRKKARTQNLWVLTLAGDWQRFFE